MIVEYNIERFNDDKEWIHCCYAGKTKEAALRVLKRVASYKHHQRYEFRIVREEYEPERLL